MSRLFAHKIVLFFCALISLSHAQARPFEFEGTDLIYGNDDRYEVDNYPDFRFVEKAKSVAIKVPSRYLHENREDSSLINFPNRKLKQSISNICPDEKFIDQRSIGQCTGFLIAPNKLVTAGHCMISESDCSSTKWVFNYKESTEVFKKSDVYSCKKIISQKYIYNGDEISDYAVVELDRHSERVPLIRRKFGRVRVNAPLVVIGHPLGLPMKIADEARVSKLNDEELQSEALSWFLRSNYFNSNLDVFAGSSGSPVFNKKTGKVEGILIQGAEDFVYNEEKKCVESRRLSDSPKNSFEGVMRITKVPGI